MYMIVNTKPETQEYGSDWDPLYQSDIRKTTLMSAK